MNDDIRIFPLGDAALTVEFGNVSSPGLNEKAIALAEGIAEKPFAGFIEAIPAYSSTTIIYDPNEVRRTASIAFEAVRNLILTAVNDLTIKASGLSRLIEVPMLVDETASPDLEHVAMESGLKTDEILDIFTSREYRVYMLGFLPGFSYMGDVDDRIATPRRETPRTNVPKNSIGIAGKQTGIYSLASPGGWQIIGRAAIEAFTPNGECPSLFRAGDRVRFRIVG